MGSVSGVWDPFDVIFPSCIMEGLSSSTPVYLGTYARPATGQRLYKQRMGVAALCELLTEKYCLVSKGVSYFCELSKHVSEL